MILVASLVREIAYPLSGLLLMGLWVYCIVDALRGHRPWVWVVLVTFVPVLSAPVYLVNFKLMGGGSNAGGGILDAAIEENRRLRQLQARAREADIPSTHREIARIFLSRGQFEDALAHLKRALDAEPEDIPAQYLAGLAFQGLDRHGEALAHLRFVEEEEPRHDEGGVGAAIGRSLELSGDLDAAESAFESAMVRDAHPEAIVRWARLVAARGDRDRAREALATLIDRAEGMAPDRARRYAVWLKEARSEYARFQR